MSLEEKNNENIHCYKCDHDLQITSDSKIYRDDDCDKCGASLHVCKMCTFYDEHSYNECREPVAQRILDKEKANFCDTFKLKPGGDLVKKQQDHLSAANALFKD